MTGEQGGREVAGVVQQAESVEIDMVPISEDAPPAPTDPSQPMPAMQQTREETATVPLDTVSAEDSAAPTDKSIDGAARTAAQLDGLEDVATQPAVERLDITAQAPETETPEMTLHGTAEDSAGEHPATLPQPAVERVADGSLDVLPGDQPDIAPFKPDVAETGPLESPDPTGPGREIVADQPELQMYDYVVSSDDSDAKSDAGRENISAPAQEDDATIEDAEMGAPEIGADDDTAPIDDGEAASAGLDSGAGKAEHASESQASARVETRDDVDLMGEAQDGVGDDERSAAEEDDDDSQRDEPLYDGGSDDSDSDELITYDDDLEATDKKHRHPGTQSPPTQSRAQSEELEAEPDTLSELEAEIRHHERRPIPHATLLEENEEYGIDGDTPYQETQAFQLTSQYEVVTEDGDPDESGDELSEGPDAQSGNTERAIPESDAAVGEPSKPADDDAPNTAVGAYDAEAEESPVDDNEEVDVSPLVPGAVSITSQRNNASQVETTARPPPPADTHTAERSQTLSKSQRKRLRRKERKEKAEKAAKKAKHAFDAALRAQKPTDRRTEQSASDEASDDDSAATPEDEGNRQSADQEDTSDSEAGSAAGSGDDQDETSDRAAEGNAPAAVHAATQSQTLDADQNAASTQGPPSDHDEDAAPHDVYYANVKRPGQWRKGMPIRFSEGPVRSALLDEPSTASPPAKTLETAQADAIANAANAGAAQGDEVDVFPVPGDAAELSIEADAVEHVASPSANREVQSGDGDQQEAEEETDDIKHGHHPVKVDEDVLALEPPVLQRKRSQSPEAEHKHAFADALAAVHDDVDIEGPGADVSGVNAGPADVDESMQDEASDTAQGVDTAAATSGSTASMADDTDDAGNAEQPADASAAAAGEADGDQDEAPSAEPESLSVPSIPAIAEPITPPRGTTPLRQNVPPSPDPTRHYHAHHRRTPSVGMSTGSPRTLDTSPAHATRSQCRYHRIAFLDGADKPDLIIPGCTVDYGILQRVRAEDKGEASKTDMTSGIKIIIEDDHILSLSQKYALPEKLIHDLRIMIGKKLFDEGHCYVVPGTSDEADRHLLENELVAAETPTPTPSKRKRQTVSPVAEADEQDDSEEPQAKRRVIEVAEGKTVEDAEPMDVETVVEAVEQKKGGLFSFLPSWFSRR